MYSALLSLHIGLGIAGLLFATVTVSALLADVRPAIAQRRVLLHTLLSFVSAQVITGVFLGVVSEEVTVVSLCGNVLAYSVFMAGASAFLHFRSELHAADLRPAWMHLPLSAFALGAALALGY